MFTTPSLSLLPSGAWGLYGDDQLLAELRSVFTDPIQLEHLVSTAEAVRLSRVAYLRAVEDGWAIVVPPVARFFSLIVHDERLLTLLNGSTVHPDFSREIIQAFWGLVSYARMSDKDDEDYAEWTFPDVIAHFSPRDELPKPKPAPPIKPPMSDQIVPLTTAKPEMLLTAALDLRHTEYRYGETSITCDQLGALLDLSARAREFVPGAFYDTTRRPYPSAGAAYGLEIYALVARCDGLERGFYHYQPFDHHLERLTIDSNHAGRLIEAAVESTGGHVDPPQVILFVTARMERMNWKNCAYLLAHQDTGALLQNLYLAATALGLAPCALGGVPQWKFTTVFGVSPAHEPLICAFLIGSARLQN